MVHNLDVEPKCNKRKSTTGWQITGYKGVSNGKNGKFAARFTSNGKNNNIGTFATAIQAALAYDQAAIKAGRKKSSLNFPDGLSIKQEDPEAVIMNNQTTNTQEEETTVKLELEAKC